MMMSKWRLISCNKGTTLVGDVDNGEGQAYMGGEGDKKISVPSSMTQYFLPPSPSSLLSLESQFGKMPGAFGSESL